MKTRRNNLSNLFDQLENGSKLSNTSQFNFESIEGIDLNDLVKNTNLKILQENLDNIAFRRLDEGNLSRSIPQRSIETFKLVQSLIVNILKLQENEVVSLEESTTKYKDLKREVKSKKEKVEKIIESNDILQQQIQEQRKRMITLESIVKATRHKQEMLHKHKEQEMYLRQNNHHQMINFFVAITNLSGNIIIEMSEKPDTEIRSIVPIIQRNISKSISKIDTTVDVTSIIVEKLIHRGRVIYDASDPHRLAVDSVITLKLCDIRDGETVVVAVHSKPFSEPVPVTRNNTELLAVAMIESQQNTMKEMATEMRRSMESALQAVTTLHSQQEAKEREDAIHFRQQHEQDEVMKREQMTSVVSDKLNRLEYAVRDQLNSQLQVYENKLQEVISLQSSKRHIYSGELEGDGDGPFLSASEILKNLQQSSSIIQRLDSEVGHIHQRIDKFQETVEKKFDNFSRLESIIREAISKINTRPNLVIKSDNTIHGSASQPINNIQNMVSNKLTAAVASASPIVEATQKITVLPEVVEKQDSNILVQISPAYEFSDPSITQLTLSISKDIPTDEVVYYLRKSIASILNVSSAKVTLRLYGINIRLKYELESVSTAEGPIDFSPQVVQSLAGQGVLTYIVEDFAPMTNSQLDFFASQILGSTDSATNTNLINKISKSSDPIEKEKSKTGAVKASNQAEAKVSLQSNSKRESKSWNESKHADSPILTTKALNSESERRLEKLSRTFTPEQSMKYYGEVQDRRGHLLDDDDSIADTSLVEPVGDIYDTLETLRKELSSTFDIDKLSDEEYNKKIEDLNNKTLHLPGKVTEYIGTFRDNMAEAMGVMAQDSWYDSSQGRLSIGSRLSWMSDEDDINLGNTILSLKRSLPSSSSFDTTDKLQDTYSKLPLSVSNSLENFPNSKAPEKPQKPKKPVRERSLNNTSESKNTEERLSNDNGKDAPTETTKNKQIDIVGTTNIDNNNNNNNNNNGGYSNSESKLNGNESSINIVKKNEQLMSDDLQRQSAPKLSRISAEYKEQDETSSLVVSSNRDNSKNTLSPTTTKSWSTASSNISKRSNSFSQVIAKDTSEMKEKSEAVPFNPIDDSLIVPSNSNIGKKVSVNSRTSNIELVDTKKVEAVQNEVSEPSKSSAVNVSNNSNNPKSSCSSAAMKSRSRYDISNLEDDFDVDDRVKDNTEIEYLDNSDDQVSAIAKKSNAASLDKQTKYMSELHLKLSSRSLNNQTNELPKSNIQNEKETTVRFEDSVQLFRNEKVRGDIQSKDMKKDSRKPEKENRVEFHGLSEKSTFTLDSTSLFRDLQSDQDDASMSSYSHSHFDELEESDNM